MSACCSASGSFERGMQVGPHSECCACSANTRMDWPWNPPPGAMMTAASAPFTRNGSRVGTLTLEHIVPLAKPGAQTPVGAEGSSGARPPGMRPGGKMRSGAAPSSSPSALASTADAVTTAPPQHRCSMHSWGSGIATVGRTREKGMRCDAPAYDGGSISHAHVHAPLAPESCQVGSRSTRCCTSAPPRTAASSGKPSAARCSSSGSPRRDLKQLVQQIAQMGPQYHWAGKGQTKRQGRP